MTQAAKVSGKRYGFFTAPRLWKTLALWLDAALGAAAMYFAIWYRYAIDPRPEPEHIAWQSAVAFALATAVAFYTLGVHRNVWRYSGVEDLWRILKAITLANLIFVPAMFVINRGIDFPRTSIFLELPVFAGLAIGFRVLASRLSAWRGQFAVGPIDNCKPVTLLVGAAADAASALAAARMDARGGDRSPRIAGIITTDDQHIGRAIRGVRILGGPDEIDDAIEKLRHDYGSLPQVAVAGALTNRKAIEIALAAASKVRATIYRFSPGDGAAYLAPIAPADLLTRPPHDISSKDTAALIEGKRVLVTGAGGSIGSELCRQIAAAKPAQLILFEASERNLYEIDMELSERFPGVPRLAAFGDVRDIKRVEEVFSQNRPEVVMHAAALKHVPLMELNPNEAILTNVCGVKAIADAAAAWGCGAFVFISTDKAVNPSNVMGSTKRAGEIYVRAMAETYPQIGWAAVRFGNVLGSAGSVLPLFERQISQGGPVTVTDPEITRYFMTVQEASRLVIAAAAHAFQSQVRNGKAPQQGLRGGEVYVLDMGSPVKIVDLAEQLIRLKGLEPNEDIKIVFTGLRPGE
ncbi:MAG: polysaccharide biosynthesis protein, partial [Caulobacterales bacterium]